MRSRRSGRGSPPSPRAYAVHVAGGTPVDQDLMEDWAAVNDGAYTYVRDQGEMDIALIALRDGAAPPGDLHAERRAHRTATATDDHDDDLDEHDHHLDDLDLDLDDHHLDVDRPASTRHVVRSRGAAATGGASRGRWEREALRSSSTRPAACSRPWRGDRIDVAKAALIELVTRRSPPGTQVSLRAFGVVPDSCDTRLVVPNAARPGRDGGDDPEGAGRQPRPDAAGRVARGGRGGPGAAPGPKIVVFVTDGEETCGGDSAAAIQALVDSGIDVRVNIVGFALDDEALKAQFEEWARIGNGRYIDAGNQAELTAADGRRRPADLLRDHGDGDRRRQRPGRRRAGQRPRWDVHPGGAQLPRATAPHRGATRSAGGGATVSTRHLLGPARVNRFVEPML